MLPRAPTHLKYQLETLGVWFKIKCDRQPNSWLSWRWIVFVWANNGRKKKRNSSESIQIRCVFSIGWIVDEEVCWCAHYFCSLINAMLIRFGTNKIQVFQCQLLKRAVLFSTHTIEWTPIKPSFSNSNPNSNRFSKWNCQNLHVQMYKISNKFETSNKNSNWSIWMLICCDLLRAFSQFKTFNQLINIDQGTKYLSNYWNESANTTDTLPNECGNQKIHLKQQQQQR